MFLPIKQTLCVLGHHSNNTGARAAGRMLQMDNNIEHFKLLHCIQKLPLWIIVEYAWAHKMIDILGAVAADEELSLWPEVDLETLTLEEAWRVRVASAQAYSIVRKRDIGQFEKVLALLDTTHRLVPRLVSPIKHMKIMFGLKTMIVMWMLKNNKGIVDTVVKIIQYFPSKLPKYRDQCSCHDMYLMRKNHQDFKNVAQTLVMDKNKLQNYISGQMEEQYGERYAHKLQDRLLRYLQELEAVLPRQTYIDELLKEERPRTEEERLLLEVITFDETSLKRLLHCVLASGSSGRLSQKAHQVSETCVSSLKAAQHSRPSEVVSVPVEVEPQEMRAMDDVARHLPEDSPLLLEDEEDEDSVEEGRRQQRTTEKEPYKERDNVAEGQAMEMAESESSSGASDVDERARDGKERSAAGTRRDEEAEEWEMHVEGDDDKENENSERSNDSAPENVPSPRFWCKRHQWVKSILHECSDEQPEQLQVQHDVTTSPTTLFKFTSSTSPSLDLTPSPFFSCPLVLNSHPDSSTSSTGDLTPSLTFSCPLIRSLPVSWTSTPPETAWDSNKTDPTDKSGSGIVGLAPTALQTEPALQLSSSDDDVVTLLSPVFHPLKYSTASNPLLSTSSQPSTIPSRQHHALSCLPEPVASTYSHTLSNKDAMMSQNAPSTSAGWPAPTRRPLSRLSRRFQRNHLATSRQQHSLSNPPELVAFPYSSTLSLSNRDSVMSQDDSTSTGCLSPSPRRPLSRLSRRFRRNCSVVSRSQASTSFNPIPEHSGTHRQPTSPLFFTESNISVHSTLASAPNLQSRTLSDQAPLSSEQAIHLQPVIVPQTCNSVLSSPCVQLDLNAGLNIYPAQTLPCPSTISQHSISQIASQADRTLVRMSPQCQSMLLRSKLLQPLVRLTRLSQQQCSRGVTVGRSLTRKEDSNNEVGDGNQDLTDTSFNINRLYSSDESFDHDNEDSHDSDPDYIPSVKQRVHLREYESNLH